LPVARISKCLTLVMVMTMAITGLALATSDNAEQVVATQTISSTDTATNDVVLQLSLADTIALAEANSSTIALQELSVKEAELNLKTAQVNLNITYTAKQLEDAQATLAIAQAQVQLAHQAQALAACQHYISVLKAQHTLRLANANVEQADRQLNIVRERLSAGIATQTDLYLAESNLRRAQLTQRQATAALESENIQFNQLIGRHLFAPFELVDQPRQEIPTWDMDKDIAQAQATRLDITQLRTNLQLAERNLSLADERYTSQAQIERLKMAVERASIALEQVQIKVMLEVRDAIILLETARINAELANDALEQQLMQLQAATLRHDSGLITTSELLDAQAEANATEVKAVQATYDVELAIARYLNAIGSGYSIQK
jgi:outer membrane protein TolC